MINRQTAAYASLVSSLATIISAVVVFLLPLLFLTNTTEFFTFPKQILVVAGAFVLLALYCIKSLIEKKIIFVKNPFNLAVLIFTVIITVSAYISPSSLSAIPQAMTVVAAALLFYMMVNLTETKQNMQIIILSLIAGTALSSIISILSSFHVYLLPFEATKNEFFNTLGSPIQMLAFLTPVAIYTLATILFRYRRDGKKAIKTPTSLFYIIATVLFALTISIIFYQIATSENKPILLPFEHGFQLALASVSQDASRLLPSFLFGSGYSAFSPVFTRFHLPSFNEFTFWGLTFSFSSSYALELIATTGILGILAYLFLIVRFVKSKSGIVIKSSFIMTAAVLLLSFLLPFSYALVALLFISLALYVLNLKFNHKTKMVDEMSVSLVSNGGFFEFGEAEKVKKNNIVLPVVLTIVSVVFMIYSLFFLIMSNGGAPKGLYHYVVSDMTFAKSLSSLDSVEQTYNLQLESIRQFPYRADLYRIFSQLNLALATNLANSQKDAPTPSEDVQQAIIQQLQQAINSARQSVILAPQSSLNWRNLGQVYRNLIGVGENAEQFAIASYNQAIALEPNNPALRIELGGIYYQLQEFDLAQTQFQQAIALKPNYANAYYNLGHALEEKGELEQALQQYLIVKQLVANDESSLTQINMEIKDLQGRIGAAAEEVQAEEVDAEADDTTLELQQEEPQFEERNPREEIPAPPTEDEVRSQEAQGQTQQTTPSPSVPTQQ